MADFGGREDGRSGVLDARRGIHHDEMRGKKWDTNKSHLVSEDPFSLQHHDRGLDYLIRKTWFIIVAYKTPSAHPHISAFRVPHSAFPCYSLRPIQRSLLVVVLAVDDTSRQRHPPQLLSRRSLVYSTRVETRQPGLVSRAKPTGALIVQSHSAQYFLFMTPSPRVTPPILHNPPATAR